MDELEKLYVGMTDVTARGLAVVPRKERMQMMRTGKGAMTANQLDEMMQLYPKTQIFDPSGYPIASGDLLLLVPLKDGGVNQRRDGDMGTDMAVARAAI